MTSSALRWAAELDRRIPVRKAGPSHSAVEYARFRQRERAGAGGSKRDTSFLQRANPIERPVFLHGLHDLRVRSPRRYCNTAFRA